MCRDKPFPRFSKRNLRVTIASDDGRAADALVCLDRGGACRGRDGRRRRRGRRRAGPQEPAQHRLGHQLADKEAKPSVDVELVLAVDVSYSMDMDELAIQREGYAQAIISKEFLQALKTGPNGKIAVTYFEWAASSDQKIIIPWRVIDGPETADAVANEIMKTPIRRASRTSISGAINFAMPLFDENPYRGLRRVIDISGDGPNNNGAPVTDRARRGAGEGNHHQRPADHGEGAVLFDDGYRQPRSLLRGLRDRRPGLLRGDDQGARQVQGGDPHQAAARSRRPDAGAPDRPGGREGSRASTA